jgi:hypothetical protein
LILILMKIDGANFLLPLQTLLMQGNVLRCEAATGRLVCAESWLATLA